LPCKLDTADVAPVDPPTLKTSEPSWHPGDTIPFGRRALRVLGVRDDDADKPPALIVEEAEARRAPSD
jgi:hypothetical protein